MNHKTTWIFNGAYWSLSIGPFVLEAPTWSQLENRLKCFNRAAKSSRFLVILSSLEIREPTRSSRMEYLEDFDWVSVTNGRKGCLSAAPWPYNNRLIRESLFSLYHFIISVLITCDRLPAGSVHQQLQPSARAISVDHQRPPFSSKRGSRVPYRIGCFYSS